MVLKTPQRVLAIVGGAFLIGTVQAVVFGPIVLGPANLTSGTDGVNGRPSQSSQPSQSSHGEPEDSGEPVDPAGPVPGVELGGSLEDAAHDAVGDGIPESVQSGHPTATFTGVADALLDAVVPEGSLTLRESHILWEQGAYFLDARHESEYNAGHIQYAAFLAAQLFDTDIERANSVMDSIPQDATIVLYCLGGDCDASKNTAAMLEQYGYTDLRIMGAAYDDWVAAGFETETGLDGGGSP